MKQTRTGLTIGGAFMVVMLPLKVVFADPVALPPLPVLTAQWWQWSLSIPTSVNPSEDPTGQNCMVGQRDDVWFLAGIFSGGSATRTCSVPEGATLFFPAVSFVDFNTPNCPPGTQNKTAKQLQAEIQPAINNIHDVSVTIDGQDVKKTLLRRVQSEPFELAFPTENLFGPDACGPGAPLAAGIYSPAVDGGDYVSVSPLSRGTHTIHFHAESDSNFFGHVAQDVTYNLTVVPISLK
jgi:hypothetical protein